MAVTKEAQERAQETYDQRLIEAGIVKVAVRVPEESRERLINYAAKLRKEKENEILKKYQDS